MLIFKNELKTGGRGGWALTWDVVEKLFTHPCNGQTSAARPPCQSQESSIHWNQKKDCN